MVRRCYVIHVCRTHIFQHSTADSREPVHIFYVQLHAVADALFTRIRMFALGSTYRHTIGLYIHLMRIYKFVNRAGLIHVFLFYNIIVVVEDMFVILKITQRICFQSTGSHGLHTDSHGFPSRPQLPSGHGQKQHRLPTCVSAQFMLMFCKSKFEHPRREAIVAQSALDAHGNAYSAGSL